MTVSLLLFLSLASADYFPPADKDGGWRRGSAGVDVSRLDQAFEFEKETSQHGGASWCATGTWYTKNISAKETARRIPIWHPSARPSPASPAASC